MIKGFLSALALLFLGCINFIGTSAHAATVDTWRAVEYRKAEKMDGGIVFDGLATFDSRPLLLNLSANTMVTLRFSDIKGVVLARVEFETEYGGAVNTVSAEATLLPHAGSRRVRFDFSSNPEFRALGKRVFVHIVGYNAKASYPVLTIDEPGFLDRVSIFVEEWFRPASLDGMYVNVFLRPEFLGLSSLWPIAIMGMVGLGICVFRGRGDRKILKSAVPWILILWIGVDMTIAYSRIVSIPRIKFMHGRYSDSTKFNPGDAREIKGILERLDIRHLGVLNDEERSIMRYYFLPIRVNPDYWKERVLLIRMLPDIEIGEGEIIWNGRAVFKKTRVLGVTERYLLVEGEAL